MANDEESENSLPYIDDLETDDEGTHNQRPYNLKIIENYQNRNRNIEITNKYSDEVISKSLSPVAPLAEESELSDVKASEDEEADAGGEGRGGGRGGAEDTCKHLSTNLMHPGQTGMKLVIKGWNSTIKIQGLDNKSSIVFKRKSEQIHQDKTMRREQRREKTNGALEKPGDGPKPQEKSRKGRWKMLTKSLITKSSRFERKGLDERYPKYVLLKDEEEEEGRLDRMEGESYPKMVLVKEKSSRKALTPENENVKATKSEFNFKKSFKNKTKPVVSMDELLEKPEKSNELQKRPLTERRPSEARNMTLKKKVIVERRKSFAVEKMPTPSKPEPEMVFNVSGRTPSQGGVFNEIQGIFEDTLNLFPDSRSNPQDFIPKGGSQQPENLFAPQAPPEHNYTSIPPQYCQFHCNNPCCHSSLDQPPVYIPVYSPYSKPGHFYKHSDTQTNENEFKVLSSDLKDGPEQKEQVEDLNLESLPFGLLSSFFPRVVIMKTFQTDDLRVEEATDDAKGDKPTDFQPLKIDQEFEEEEFNIATTLQVPQPDLEIKSKMIPFETKPEPGFDTHPKDWNEASNSDDDHKTKTDDSEATEYLNLHENDSPENDLTSSTVILKDSSKTQKPETVESKTSQNAEDDHKVTDENSRNLSLTKIGYKMYDNLTKLSLNREKEMNKNQEAKGCGCNDEPKKPPCNITLESNNRIIKVTVPENELSFQIVNSEGPGIQIGVTSHSENDEKEMKIVSKGELWHPDNGRKGSGTVTQPKTKKSNNDQSKDSQKIRLSLADNKEVVLSIETNENDRKPEMTKPKATKEMKVGTDDFDLAGGDFPCNFGSSYKNLSPRTGRLLRHLQEKLEFGERERKFLEEKMKEKFMDRRFEGGILPGIFLVKQISPRGDNILKKPSEVPSLKKVKKIQSGGGIRDEVRGQIREYYCEECLATMRIFEDENPSVKSMVDKFETIIQLESY